MRWKYLQVAGDEATEEFYTGDGRMRSVIVRKKPARPAPALPLLQLPRLLFRLLVAI